MATHSSVLAWRIPGQGSLVRCRLWGRTESETTEATQQQQQCCDSLRWTAKGLSHTYKCIHPFSPKLPSDLGCHITLSRVPCAMQQDLVGYPYFKYGSVCMSIPNFLTVPSPHSSPLTAGSTCVSCSVVCNSLPPHEQQPTKLLCPWNSSDENTGVGSHSPSPRDLPNPRIEPGSLHCRQILYRLSYQGSP